MKYFIGAIVCIAFLSFSTQKNSHKPVYNLIIITEVAEVSGTNFIPLECVVNERTYDGSTDQYIKINDAIEKELQLKYKNRKLAFFREHNGNNHAHKYVVVLMGVCHDSFLGRKKRNYSYCIKPTRKEAMESAKAKYSGMCNSVEPSVVVDQLYK